MALLAILAIELVITLADFVEEDRSRALSPQERVLHGILTLNYGAFLAFILPALAAQAAMPSAIFTVDHGWMSWLLTIYAVGSSGFGVREALAAHRLGRERRRRSSNRVPTRGRRAFWLPAAPASSAPRWCGG
jgi:hypothetical protein